MTQEELNDLMTSTGDRHMIVAMAAWCTPCRKELPDLVRLYDKYRARNLKMVGISLDVEGPEAIQPVLDRARVNFPVYWVGEQAIQDYDIFAIPMIFLIQNGRIVEKIPGKKKYPFLEKKVEALLGGEYSAE